VRHDEDGRESLAAGTRDGWIRLESEWEMGWALASWAFLSI